MHAGELPWAADGGRASVAPSGARPALLLPVSAAARPLRRRMGHTQARSGEHGRQARREEHRGSVRRERPANCACACDTSTRSGARGGQARREEHRAADAGEGLVRRRTHARQSDRPLTSRVVQCPAGCGWGNCICECATQARSGEHGGRARRQEHRAAGDRGLGRRRTARAEPANAMRGRCGVSAAKPGGRA
jgi:hypothetical protein